MIAVFYGNTCAGMNSVIDNYARYECGMFELQELSALVQFLSDAEKDFYDRIKSKIKLESVVNLVYSYFGDLSFVSLLKVSNACAAGAWDDFV